MAWTQSDVDAMKKAIASAVNIVRFADGREVTYREMGEMKTALELMQSEVSRSSSGGASVSYASFSKD